MYTYTMMLFKCKEIYHILHKLVIIDYKQKQMVYYSERIQQCI